MNNELAGTVLAADVKAQYDAQCKLVLSQKEVLAWILQGVAEEFFCDYDRLKRPGRLRGRIHRDA